MRHYFQKNHFKSTTKLNNSEVKNSDYMLFVSLALFVLAWLLQ